MVVYDDFYPSNYLQDIELEIANYGFNYGHYSSKKIPYTHWNMNFGLKVNIDNRLCIAKELPRGIFLAWHYLNATNFNGDRKLVRCYANQYTYGTEGYVHKDSSIETDLTSILYLNKNWDVNWFGATCLIEDSEIIKSVMPRYNRLFTFKSNLDHAAMGVSRICHEARRVLVFKSSI